MSSDYLKTTFGPVWDAAGVRGFYGSGYRFHQYLGPLKPNFQGSCFVAKTSTCLERLGNTPFDENFETRELFPRSVYVSPWSFIQGYTLNAWGLSGPGLEALFRKAIWQLLEEPFMLSFMPAPGSQAEQLTEVEEAVAIYSHYLPGFQSKVALQLNLSCPNTETDTAQLVKEAHRFLDIMSALKVPIIPKVSVDMNLQAVAEIADHPACAGLCLSNAVKFGKLPNKLNWNKLYGKTSPLASMGGGGLSGAPLLPLTAEYVTRLRGLGVTKHINAGGGILCKSDVDIMANAGANSIFLGSMAMLRPWRVQETIRHAHQLFAK